MYSKVASESSQTKTCKLVINCVILVGDYEKDDLPAADLYILSAVLHKEDDESAARIIKKVQSSLQPGKHV